MTTNSSAGTAGAATFARYGLAACAAAFPVLSLLALLLSPWGDLSAEGREYVEQFAGDLEGYTAQLWLWPLAWIVAIPAVLAVGRVARSRAPALGLVGLILGYLFVIPTGTDTDEVIYASLKAGIDVDTTTALVTSVDENLPSTLLSSLPWFVGVIGIALLGVAILRGKSAPVWAGIALIVGPIAIPLTFFSGVAVALVLAWGVMGVGFAGCALALVRQPAPEPASPVTAA